MNGTAVHAVLDKDGNFGINTAAPSNKLEVNGIASIYSGLRLGSAGSGEGIIRHGGPTAMGIGITTGALSSPNIKLFVAHANDGGGVGIGTTAPKAKLQVSGGGYFTGFNNRTGSGVAGLEIGYDGSQSVLQSYNRSNNTYRPLHVNASTASFTQGGVGIGLGTTAPGYKLHVKETGTNGGAIYVEDGTSWLRVVPNLGGSGFNPMSVAGDIGLIFSNDNDNSTNSSTNGLLIAPHSTSASGIKILEDGRVGIATTTPNSRFTVNVGSQGDGIELQSSEVSIAKLSRTVYGSTVVASLDGVTGRPIHIGGIVNEDVLLANAGGNVGIGTTSPVAKLDVNGITKLGNSSYSAGIDTITDGALVVPQGKRIVSQDSAGNNYLRTIFAHDTSTGNYVFGQSGTSLIGDMVFHPGSSGNFRVFASGSEDFRIDTAGNVGIGITTPYYKLDTRFSNTNTTLSGGSSGEWGSNGIRIDNTNATVGAMALAHFRVGDADWHIGNKRVGTDQADFIFANEGATKMLIDHTGNVGIGTTSPTEKLHIHAGGIYSTPVTYAANQNNWGLKLGASNHAGWDYLGIKVIVDSTGSPRMALMSSGSNETISVWAGKAGIGTTSPAFKLDVQEANGNTLARFKDSDSSHSGIVIAGDVNAGWVGNDVGVTGEGIYYQSSNNFMRFYTNSSEQMRIDNSGRLLVNATSTAFNDKLYIGGDGYATGGWRTGTGATFVGELTNISGKLALQSDASRDIQLGDTNNPDIVYIDTSAQNVGIGTDSPSKPLDVQFSGDSGVWIESTDNHASLYIDAHSAYGSYLRFSQAGADKYWINVDTNGNMLFRPAATGTEGNIITFNSSGRVGIGKTTVKAKLQVEEYGIDTTTSSTAATTQVAIHTFPIADFRSARFTIQITNTTDSTYHSTEILAIHDGTTANITEFGEVHTGSSVEATFDADVSSGNFRLLATPTSTNSMAFKVVCHSLTV